jgi:hypothetical protein
VSMMKRKKKVLGILGATVLAVASTERAEAALFISISANAANATCDNSTPAGVTACTAAGFATSLDSNNIGFGGASGAFSVGGYTFSGSSGVNANVPGDVLSSFVSDSKLTVTHTAGDGDLTVIFAAFNFTLPGGLLSLSASSTGNYTVANAGDVSNFTAWGRADNLPIIPGGTVAVTPPCAPVPGAANNCATQSPDVLFTRLATPFALTGREIVHEAIGSIASYQGTAIVSSVPEPPSMLLFGTGLIALTRRLRKRTAK